MQTDDQPITVPVPADTPDAVPTLSDAPPSYTPPRRSPSLASRWRERLGPLWGQTWRNLRVWLPGLANPDFRDREVIYGARESREVNEWQIALPERCWECDTTNELSHAELRGTVRSFEYALYIFVGGLATSLVLALFSLLIWSWFTALLALVALVATFGLLWLKSWQESIRVAVWSCPEHEASDQELEIVVDDAELHLFLPNRRIAEHARESLKKSRRSRGAYDTDAGPGAVIQPRPISVDDEISSLPLSTNVPGSGRYVSPHGPTGPSVPDLPPIEIDDGPLLAGEDQAGDDQAGEDQTDGDTGVEASR